MSEQPPPPPSGKKKEQQQQPHVFSQEELHMKLAHQKCLEHVDKALRINTIQYIMTAIKELSAPSSSTGLQQQSGTTLEESNNVGKANGEKTGWRQQQTSYDDIFAYGKQSKEEAAAALEASVTASIAQLGKETLEETEDRLTDDVVPILCLPSSFSSQSGAGYIWNNTAQARRGDIVIFEDLLTTSHDVELSLRHELIHAFDDKRAFVDPSNCLQHACSEVRAARLSGDCFYGEEVKRGHLGVGTSGQKCVRRRAELSLEQNPMCKGYGRRAVEVVFSRCYVDYEPFVNPLYQTGDYVPPF